MLQKYYEEISFFSEKCSAVNVEERYDCGSELITEEECINVGCCYNNETVDVVWCFDPDKGKKTKY